MMSLPRSLSGRDAPAVDRARLARAARAARAPADQTDETESVWKPFLLFLLSVEVASPVISQVHTLMMRRRSREKMLMGKGSPLSLSTVEKG